MYLVNSSMTIRQKKRSNKKNFKVDENDENWGKEKKSRKQKIVNTRRDRRCSVQRWARVSLINERACSDLNIVIDR